MFKFTKTGNVGNVKKDGNLGNVKTDDRIVQNLATISHTLEKSIFSEPEKDKHLKVNFCEKNDFQKSDFGNVENENPEICGILPLKDKHLTKNDENSGNVGNFGKGYTLVPYSLNKEYSTGVQTLPKLPTLPKPDFDPKNDPNSLKTDQNPENPPKLETLEDFSKKFKEATKKDEELLPKQKSDRELQFFESPETKDIIETCTETEVLEWIRSNPNVGHEKLYGELGNGSFKHLNELLGKKLIRPVEDGWEVTDV
jgi:hypothetical protein